MVDGSESISVAQFEIITQVILDVDEAVRQVAGDYQTSLAEYSSGYTQVTGFLNGRSSFESGVASMLQSFEVTYTGTALIEAANFLMTDGRENARRVIALMTDGRTSPPDVENLERAIELLPTMGIEIIAVGFGKNIRVSELEDITRNVPGRVIATEFNEAPEKVSEIASEVLQACAFAVVKPPTSSVCETSCTPSFLVQQAQRSLSSVSSIVISDLSDGSYMDIVMPGAAPDAVVYMTPDDTEADMFSDIDTIFSQSQELHTLLVADVDGDGDEDIIASTSGTGHLIFLFERRVDFQGNPQFRRSILTDGIFRPRGLAFGDVNGDGLGDLIVGGKASNAVFLLLQTSERVFGNAIELPFTVPGASDVTLADFNNDGHLDIVVVGSNSDRPRILSGNGFGTFVEQVTIDTPFDASHVAVGKCFEWEAYLMCVCR